MKEEVAYGFVQSQCVSTTHLQLKGDLDLTSRLKGLAPRGLSYAVAALPAFQQRCAAEVP